ncbi:hypothetical protein RUR49_12390 [Pseudoxanthobacter sp. M-2]|uniref:hypothetical protein n=1 Tax=Pseudoxanthobacter sp. M-2 TaxID=3078754 RepID=UPI0038FC16E5
MSRVGRQRGADRMRQLRQRRAAGRIVLPVEVDEGRLVDVLIASRRLHPSAADDRDSIRRALEGLIEAFRLEA